jgi:cytochrome b561
VLLIVMPILGWLGVSLYPALEIFGLFSLPALTAADQETAARVLAAHAILAWILIALIAGHVTMALYHHFVRGDNVLRRMLKELKQR